MLIDWFTVGAQLVNFLILVWLLKRFLYKPILDAIDARERRIAKALADAEATKAAAEGERETFRQKNDAFDQQRDGLLGSARDEAKAERQRLIAEAGQAADSLRAKRQEALQREEKALHDEIIRRTREEVFALARKTLLDLAGTGLEERMSERFARRLRELGDEDRETLGAALKSSSAPLLVRSAFELSADQRASIELALKETFEAPVQLRFETAPGLISGIELMANGQKVAWSIAHHLTSLEKGVSERLQNRPGTRAETEPGPEPVSEPEPEPEPARKPEREPETAPEPEPERKPDPEPESEPLPKPASGT